mgnify:CR=1 FL=1
MDETNIALAFPVTEMRSFPWIEPERRLRRIKRRFCKNLIILVAMALLVSPDPFTDVLAFGLLGKAGMSINFKALVRRKNFKAIH